MKKGLLLVLFLTLVPAVSAQFYYSPYISWPVGVLGNFNFANIYGSYAVYIDAIIFLLIFLGLGKLVFGLKEGREREEPGYKLLYIGLALMMTVSLLLLESRMGFTLLDLFGPIAAFVILIFLVIASYELAAAFIENRWIVFGLTSFAFLFFLDSFYIYFGSLSFLGEFIKSLFSSGNHRLLYLFSFVILLIGIFKSMKVKGAEGAAATAEPEVGPRPTVEHGEPTTVEPRTRGLPLDVRATLQEKDRLVGQLREQVDVLAAKLGDLRRELQQVVAAGRGDLARTIAEKETVYKNQLVRLRERQKRVLRWYAERLNKKRKELEVAGAIEAKAAVENEIKSFYAENLAEVGEPAKYDYEEGAEEKIAGIMQPRPPMLSPPQKTETAPSEQVKILPGPEEEFTDEEIDTALAAEADKIKYHVKKLDEALGFIASRKVFRKKSEAEFAAALLRGEEPRALYLNTDDLINLKKYIDFLAAPRTTMAGKKQVSLLERYLSIFSKKKHPDEKYSRYLKAFQKALEGSLDFSDALKFNEIKDSIIATSRKLDQDFKKIGLKTEKELKGKGELFGNLQALVLKDERLTDKEKSTLIMDLQGLRQQISKYQTALLNFNFKLSKLRNQLKSLLKLR